MVGTPREEGREGGHPPRLPTPIRGWAVAGVCPYLLGYQYYLRPGLLSPRSGRWVLRLPCPTPAALHRRGVCGWVWGGAPALGLPGAGGCAPAGVRYPTYYLGLPAGPAPTRPA